MAICIFLLLFGFLDCCDRFTFSAPVQWSLLVGWITIFEMILGAIIVVNESQLNMVLDIGFKKNLERYEANKGAWDMIQTEVVSNSF